MVEDEVVGTIDSLLTVEETPNKAAIKEKYLNKKERRKKERERRGEGGTHTYRGRKWERQREKDHAVVKTLHDCEKSI